MQALSAAKQDLIQWHIGVNDEGAHVRSPDFRFQEQMRETDLAIRDILRSVDYSWGSQVHAQGWCQYLAAAYMLHSDDCSCKISTVFREFLEMNLNKAASKCVGDDPLVLVNIRKETKDIMMYPHSGKYFPWKTAEVLEEVITDSGIEEVNVFDKYIETLQTAYKSTRPRFAIVDGTKLYLNLDPTEGDTTIFDKLWDETDFPEAVTKLKYMEMGKNFEHPHITLVNSNVTEDIKEAYLKKYPGKSDEDFSAYFHDLVSELNKNQETNVYDCTFKGFRHTYSEDVTYFEFCVVADIEAPYLKEGITYFVEKVKEDLDFEPRVRPKSSHHLTVAVDPREPARWPASIENVKVMLEQENEFMQQIAPYLTPKLV